ncbi:hypothetical protein MKD51_13270 [Agrococcus sp. ARC_14]|nr:hypothetical protein [Agrococcus sp. ARC_14]
MASRPDALGVVGGECTLSTLLEVLLGPAAQPASPALAGSAVQPASPALAGSAAQPGSPVPIGLVPAGAGNDLAHALGMQTDASNAAEAAKLALTGVPRRIDVGRIEAQAGVRHCLTVAALGFDARVSERTNRLRWSRGRPATTWRCCSSSRGCSHCRSG